jgi:hypothetical protein
MKMIIVALFNSVGHILNVIIVVMIVWLMFAILGVNLFAGKFFYCDITDVSKFNIETDKECAKRGGIWSKYDTNFDDVG